jgi:hypothetical protein
MKFLAITGLFAGALLLTIALKHRTEKVVVTTQEADQRYGIDDLLTDTPETAC